MLDALLLNNSQPIYSLRLPHMHGCFYCFLFVNHLCGKDNDQDRFHRCKNIGKYKLVANQIGIVQNIRCEYFYVSVSEDGSELELRGCDFPSQKYLLIEYLYLSLNFSFENLVFVLHVLFFFLFVRLAISSLSLFTVYGIKKNKIIMKKQDYYFSLFGLFATEMNTLILPSILIFPTILRIYFLYHMSQK